MSRSDWSVFAALIGCLILAWAALDQSKHPKSERYPPYRYATSNPQPTNAASPDKPQPIEYRQPCDRPDGRDESDLCAQWKAARAAESSALWAERGFWVGLGSIIGLGITILLTLRATEAAQRSAFAAEKAIEGADRPHMLLSEAKIVGLKRDILEESLDVTYKFENHGKGPAWMEKFGMAFIMPKPDEIPNFTDEMVLLSKSGWSVSPKGWYGTTDAAKVMIPIDTQEKIISGELLMLAVFAINYIDAEKRQHEHRFVLYYEITNDRLRPYNTPYWRYT